MSEVTYTADELREMVAMVDQLIRNAYITGYQDGAVQEARTPFWAASSPQERKAATEGAAAEMRARHASLTERLFHVS